VTEMSCRSMMYASDACWLCQFLCI